MVLRKHCHLASQLQLCEIEADPKGMTFHWETVEDACDRVCSVIIPLKAYWNKSHFNATSARDVEDTRLIGDVDNVLKVEFLEHRIQGLRIIAKAVSRQAQWLEGCACHEHLLVGEASYSARMKRMREAGLVSGTCPWKGRRGTEMASGVGFYS